MNLLSGFLRLRRSTRAFIRSPGLSLALPLTIALGVGCNAAIYGFLQGLIHPLSPGRNADRLVSIFREDRWGNAGPLTPDEFQRARNNHEVFEWMGAARIGPRSASIAGYSEIATVAAVTPDLAGTLSLPLNRGVVISQRISKTEFSGKESAVGARILVDGAEFRIEGVASNNLDGLYSDEKVDLWIPAEAADIQGNAQYRRDLWVVARLRKDVSVREAQSSLSFRSAGQGEIVVAPFTGLAPKMAGGLLRIGMFLTFAVGGVFFIACSNVASFLLGRALRRSRETSLRIALGATRAELLWDLLSDSLVIALAGGAVGLFLGLLTARALPALLFEGDAERLSFAPRLLPILIAATVCIAITAVCGMLPVAGTMTDRPWMVLQRESGSSSRPILRLRSALVVAQIAICCVLVICTAILLGALHSALQTSAGSRLGDPILLTVQAQPIQGPEIDAGFFDEVAKRAQSVGGLLPLAWTARLPGNQPTWRSFRRQQPFEQSRDLSMDISWLSPGSMQALGIQLIAGRMFGINDQRYRVAVVNEEAAAHLSGKQTAGMVIQDSNKLPIEIIGVVKEGQQVPTNRHVPQLGRRATIYYGFLNQSDPPHTIRDAGFHVPVTQKRPAIELSANVVSASYFRTLGMSANAGKEFGGGRISGEGRVAVINQEAADLYFERKALGSGVIDDNGVRTEIIGVVQSQAVGTFEQHAGPTIYFPIWQDCPARMTLMLKGSQWNSGIAAHLRHEVENVAGGTTGSVTIMTLKEQLAQSGLAPLRIATLIGGVSAALALLLGVLGLLNAQSDAERQRQRDRAVRMALGAQRWRIVLLVMGTVGRLALLGVLLGVTLSVAIARFLIVGVAAAAPPSFQVWLIAPLLPVAAVMIASLAPARRASAAEPAEIMRDM